MTLSQFQRLIYNDLKEHGLSNSSEIAMRIRRMKKPIEFQLGKMITAGIVRTDGSNRYTLTEY